MGINRQKQQRKLSALSWCNRCDAELVNNNEKCPNCDFKYKTKQFKIRDIRKIKDDNQV